MTTTLASKRVVLVLILASASIVLISGSREWVSGSVGDASLGTVALHGKGSDIAPGAMAAALVGLAAAVAAATSGGVVRVLAAWSALLAALLGAGVIIVTLANPNGALSGLAASSTGRGAAVATGGQVGSWAWVALAAMLVMAFGGAGALVGSRRWDGLSSRYEVPVDGGNSAPGSKVQPGRGRDSDWEQLSRGEDPTAEP
jgi:uncharacterized membrane protein (TIGR02234 family)